MLKSTDDAYSLLATLGASEQLLHHLELVGEAGDELIAGLRALDIAVNEDVVRLGIAVHDAGKIVHPDELSEPGHEHEAAGRRLLLENGVQPEIARCCVSHAQYDRMDVSFEELLVALADKLWKGKRDQGLEERVDRRAAGALGVDRWTVFENLDACFEQIASRGDERLLRSRAGRARPQ